MEYSGGTPRSRSVLGGQSVEGVESRGSVLGGGVNSSGLWGQPAAAAWLSNRWWGAGFWSPVAGAQPARCGCGGSSPILAAAPVGGSAPHLPVVTLRLAVPISQAFTLAAKRSEHRLSCGRGGEGGAVE